MLTVQTNIALQIIATLTQEEREAFHAEFVKMHTPVVKTTPKKQIKINLPSATVLSQQILAAHRAKNNIQAQGKLA